MARSESSSQSSAAGNRHRPRPPVKGSPSLFARFSPVLGLACILVLAYYLSTPNSASPCGRADEAYSVPSSVAAAYARILQCEPGGGAGAGECSPDCRAAFVHFISYGDLNSCFEQTSANASSFISTVVSLCKHALHFFEQLFWLVCYHPC